MTLCTCTAQYSTSTREGNIQGKPKAIKNLQVCNSLSIQNSRSKVEAWKGGLLVSELLQAPAGREKVRKFTFNIHERIAKQFKKLKMFKKFF